MSLIRFSFFFFLLFGILSPLNADWSSMFSSFLGKSQNRKIAVGVGLAALGLGAYGAAKNKKVMNALQKMREKAVSAYSYYNVPVSKRILSGVGILGLATYVIKKYLVKEETEQEVKKSNMFDNLSWLGLVQDQISKMSNEEKAAYLATGGVGALAVASGINKVRQLINVREKSGLFTYKFNIFNEILSAEQKEKYKKVIENIKENGYNVIETDEAQEFLKSLELSQMNFLSYLRC